jgi:hypothetical protein
VSDGEVVAGLVGVCVAGGVVGGVEVAVAVDGVVAVVVAGGAGDVLVAGESCVGVGDVRLVAVGLADFDDDAAVPDAVPRLVPGSVWPAELPGKEAVVGPPAWLTDEPEPPGLPCPFAVGVPKLDSSTATMAMTPQVATAMPANRKARVPGRREPRNRSASF